MATQAQRLLGQGAPLTLTDGRTVHVRFGMRALAQIEQHFGSLTHMTVELNKPSGKKFTAAVHVLAAGLGHEDGLDYDALLDLLHPAQMDAYDQALEAAWEEAFPETATDEESDPNPAGEQDSPGSSGSDSSSPTLAAVPASSG